MKNDASGRPIVKKAAQTDRRQGKISRILIYNNYKRAREKCQSADNILIYRIYPLTKGENLYKINPVNEYMTLSRAVEGTAL